MSRLIHKEISKSQGFASLSKEAQIIFTLLIPHLNSYGKMNGNTHFIKGEVVPLLQWATTKLIFKCLKEIHSKTNIKYYTINGMWYLQSMSWENHQTLRRRGEDKLPNYSEVNPVPVPDKDGLEIESEEELDIELEEELEGKCGTQEWQEWFAEFWEAFDDKRGREKTFGSWLKIKHDEQLANKIIIGAKRYAIERVNILKNKGTPKMAQGWLTDKRWEDEPLKQADPYAVEKAMLGNKPKELTE